MVRRHIHDLLSDGNDRLKFLHLKLANTKIREAGKLESIKLVHGLFELVGLFIFPQKVVGHISKVKVAIDFLINFGRLNLISTLKEFTCSRLKSHQSLKFARSRVLVEVRGVLNSE